MGSTTSKIASENSLVHFAAGPISLIFAFIGNAIINLITGTPIMQVGTSAIIFGGISLFIVNMLLTAFYTVPSSVKDKCNETITPQSSLVYGLWPALFSVIGDPNIIAMITYATPLVILGPLITALMPPGPLDYCYSYVGSLSAFRCACYRSDHQLFPSYSRFRSSY